MFSKQNSERENFHRHWQQHWVWLQSVKGESSVHDQLFFPHQHWRMTECAHRYSDTRSRSNVSGAYTYWKTLIKLTFSMERLYQLTEGWYWNISLLPVPHTDSLNSLAEALCTCANVLKNTYRSVHVKCTEWWSPILVAYLWTQPLLLLLSLVGRH